MTPRLALLFALGLLVRAACLPLPGTLDVEIQKAWAARAASAGLATIYGPSDAEFLGRAAAAGRPPGDAFRSFPRAYFEWQGGQFFVDYPPGSLIVSWAAGKLYGRIDLALTSSPAFNAVINLAPLAGSAAIALMLWLSSREHGPLRALLFWLNPAVLLAAPVLGYQDTVFGSFALCAVLAMQRGRQALAAALVVAAGLVKPQGALLLPALCVLLVREAPLRTWLRAASASAVVASLILAPWWLQGHLLSALDGCRRPLTQVTLAPLGLNVWWIAGWVMQWTREGPWPLASIVAIPAFERWAGFDPRIVSRLLLLASTLGVALLLARAPRADRRFVPLAVILQVHAYALFGTSVHENHTFLAVILAPLLVGEWGRAQALHAASSSFLFADLFLMAGGFGRGFTRLRDLRAWRSLTGLDLSVIVAAAHVVMVAFFAWWALRALREARRGSGALQGPSPLSEP